LGLKRKKQHWQYFYAKNAAAEWFFGESQVPKMPAKGPWRRGITKNVIAPVASPKPVKIIDLRETHGVSVVSERCRKLPTEEGAYRPAAGVGRGSRCIGVPEKKKLGAGKKGKPGKARSKEKKKRGP